MTKKIDDGGPAFPFVTTETNEHGLVFPFVTPGMSLRDWFAGQALNGAWADGQNEAVAVKDGQTLDEAIYDHWFSVARCGYIAADAMLLARKSGGEA